MAKTLMVLGTASDVGKSLIVTGLCRLFSRAGIRVAPFKAQNMSNNAYVCFPTGEIGWAQALQAWACGLEPSVDMNPVLLKPTTERSSQIVVHGQVWKTSSAYDFDRAYVREKVYESFTRLSRDYDLIILEGAGGAAEINLKDRDMVNFAMAEAADAPVLLVADIDRGGVFAALVGTMELLEVSERERIKGFIINKFRGDLSILEPGLRMLEEKTGKPVLGVLPYVPGLALEAEDSVSLETYYKQQSAFSPSRVNIAVVTLPHIANFTDFLPLSNIDSVVLNYVSTPNEIVNADVVILPGSKNTIADLRWLKTGHWARPLRQLEEHGKSLVGVCAGYQILGQEIADPLGVEGVCTSEKGLGFLPLHTELVQEKTTRRVEAQWQIGPETGVFNAYEIHMGRTRVGPGLVEASLTPRFFVRPLDDQEEMQPNGGVSRDGKVWGTYLHGLFESGPFLRAWLTQVGARRAIYPQVEWETWTQERSLNFDRLADVLEHALDITTIGRLWQNTRGASRPRA